MGQGFLSSHPLLKRLEQLSDDCLVVVVSMVRTEVQLYIFLLKTTRRGPLYGQYCTMAPLNKRTKERVR